MTGPLRWRRPAEPDLLLDPLGIRPHIVLVASTIARKGLRTDGGDGHHPIHPRLECRWWPGVASPGGHRPATSGPFYSKAQVCLKELRARDLGLAWLSFQQGPHAILVELSPPVGLNFSQAPTSTKPSRLHNVSWAVMPTRSLSRLASTAARNVE